MIGAYNAERISVEKSAQIIQIPAAEADVCLGRVQLLEAVVVDFQLVRDPLGRLRHDLHQSPGADIGFRCGSEGAFIPDHRSDQGGGKIVFPGYTLYLIPVFQRILLVDCLLFLQVKICLPRQPGAHQNIGSKRNSQDGGQRDQGNAEPAGHLPGSLSGGGLPAGRFGPVDCFAFFRRFFPGRTGRRR